MNIRTAMMRWAVVAGILQLAVNFIVPQASIVIGMALSGTMLWLAWPEFLPAIIITLIVHNDFSGSGSLDLVQQMGVIEANSLSIFGFPVSVGMFMASMIPLRVFAEFLIFPKTSFTPAKRLLIFIWAGAILLSAYNCTLGRGEMNRSWTTPLRMMFLVGSFFYGVILAFRWSDNTELIIKQFLALMAILLGIALCGRFFHRILFIFAPMAPPLVVYAIRRLSSFWTFISVVVLIETAAYVLGLSIGKPVIEIEGGVFGNAGSTFTLNGLFFLSFALSVSLLLRGNFRGSVSAWLLGWPALTAVIAFTFTVAVYGPDLRTGLLQLQGGQLSFVERLSAKIFDDRSVIWNGALSDILDGPYVIRPSGRGMLIDIPEQGKVLWPHGAHNTILEVLRSEGLVCGAVTLIILFYAIIQVARVLRSTARLEIAILAIIVLPTGTVGILTGHYALSDNVGFWFLGFAGIVCGLHERDIAARKPHLGCPQLRNVALSAKI